jgi:hypothetical protein
LAAAQHTEATRKKLREVEFFLRRLASVDKGTVINADPEAPDFYLNAFLSAARAVQETFRKERSDEFKAWIAGWVAQRTHAQKASFKFLNEQRKMAIHEGGPELTYVVTPVSAFDFMREISQQGGRVYMSNMPQRQPHPFFKVEKAFTAVPGQTLAVACQPLYDVGVAKADAELGPRALTDRTAGDHRG